MAANLLADKVKALGVKGARCANTTDLACDAADYARVADKLPRIATLRLWKATGSDLRAALARPELAHVEFLFLFRNRLTDADLQALAACPHLTRVARLDFKWCGLSGRAAAIVAAADPRRFPALRAISFSGNKLGAKGVLALAASRLCAQLTELDLDSNHAGDEAIAQLLLAPAARNLERIVVTGNEAGPLARAAVEHAPRLVEIDGLRGVDDLLARHRGVPYAPPAAPTAPLPEAVPEAPAPSARGAELLARLVEDPSDDMRAVYADYLQEQGDPRGELIALETRLAAGDRAVAFKVDRLRTQFLRDFGQRFKNKAAEIDLDRGFVIGVGGRLDWILARGAELLAAEPIRSLKLNPASLAGLPKLADLPGIERIEWLAIQHATPQLLAAVPIDALPNVSLELSGLGSARNPGIVPFLAMPQLARVKSLRFWRVSLDDLRTIVSDKRLAHIVRLDLGYNGPLGDAAARLVIDSPLELEQMRVAGPDASEDTMARLVERFPAATVID